MNLWPVEHFCPQFFSRSVLTWKKTGDKSVQLVRGSFISKYFLQNPYFTYFLCTLYIGYDIQRYQTKKKRVCLSKFGSRWVKPAHIFWMEIPTVNFEHCLWHEILLQARIVANYQAYHVTYQVKISSINLRLADQLNRWILIPVLWLVGQHWLWHEIPLQTRILIRYQTCHVNYQLKISSMNLRLFVQSESRIQNPVLWLVHWHQIRRGNLKLMGHVTSLILCKDSSRLDTQPNFKT